MLNKKDRTHNKSKGPWGMHDYVFTYAKTGEDLERERFISAPDEESAVDQFNFIMEKAGVDFDILSIIEEE